MGKNTDFRKVAINPPQLRDALFLRPCFVCGERGLCEDREPELVAHAIHQARRFERLARRLGRLGQIQRKPPAREIAGATLARKAANQ